MRHRKRKRQLGRTGSERQAMLTNMVISLFKHQRVETTLAKAKEARRVAEKLITLGKNPALHNRRQAYALLQDKTIVKLLFEQIAPLFKGRSGGYTRILQSRNRVGDGAVLAILELTEFRAGKITGIRTEKEKSKEKIKGKPEGQPAEVKEEEIEEKPVVSEKPAPAPVQEHKEVKEEKPAAKKKGILSGLRNLFGKKENKEK